MARAVKTAKKREMVSNSGGQSVRLSTKELQLLQWLAAGRTNAEIAALSSRSHATVRNQLHNLYGKLGVANRAEAIRVASRMPLHDQT